MGSTLTWIHPCWAMGLPIALSFPLGWLMFRSLDVPRERDGEGRRCSAHVTRPPPRPARAGADGLEALRGRAAGVQPRAVRHHVRAALRAAQDPPAQPRPQGLARRTRLQDRRRRPPRRRHGRRLQHRLLVRHQHEPPALLGRAASLVLQPAGRDRLADVRHAGLGPLRDARDAPGIARGQGPGRLLRRPAAGHPVGVPAVLPDRRDAADGVGRADDPRGRGHGDDGRRGGDEVRVTDHLPRPGGGPRRDQAVRHKRRRLFRAELGAPVREPEPLEQPAVGRLDRHAADGFDGHGRPDAQEHESTRSCSTASCSRS